MSFHCHVPRCNRAPRDPVVVFKSFVTELFPAWLSVRELSWPPSCALCIVDIMDRSLTEMAIRGLEVERQRIDDAIRDLRSQIETGPGRQKQQSAQTSKRETETRTQAQSETHRETHPAQTKNQITAAGRTRIAEANRRRAQLRKESATGTKAAPTPAKKTAAKRGGLTPEGRARLAEAVRQRNIAGAAARKKAASKQS